MPASPTAAAPPTVTGFLSAEQGNKLNDLVKNQSLSFKEVAKSFESAFGAEHLQVALSLHEMQDQSQVSAAAASLTGLGPYNIVDVESHARTVNSLFISSLIMKASKGKGTTFANPVVVAKSVFNATLQRLEQFLREDSKRIEQWRIRSTAKDGAVAKSKTGGHDANLADAMRFRLMTKCFAFQALIGSTPLDSCCNKLFATDQKDAEKLLEKLSTENTSEIKEALRDVTGTQEAEIAMSFGTLKSKVVTNTINEPESYCVQQPNFTAAPPILFSRPRAGDLHIALAPYLSSVCLLDADMVGKDWKPTRDAVVAASKGSINDKQQTLLVKNLSTSVPSTQVGLTPDVYVQIAEKNPQTAAAIAPTLRAPQTYTDAVLNTSSMNSTTMNTVLGALAPSINQQSTVSKYIGAITKQLSATKDKDPIVKGFAVTLTAIVGKRSDLFAPVDKAAVGAILTPFKHLPEVSSSWKTLLE